jgi:hypothetical protein
MDEGTIRRIRGSTMRQKGCGFQIRAHRRRCLPTKYCHAAMPWETGVIREYQSDSSSKRPTESAVSFFGSIKLLKGTVP